MSYKTGFPCVGYKMYVIHKGDFHVKKPYHDRKPVAGNAEIAHLLCQYKTFMNTSTRNRSFLFRKHVAVFAGRHIRQLLETADEAVLTIVSKLQADLKNRHVRFGQQVFRDIKFHIGQILRCGNALGRLKQGIEGRHGKPELFCH